MKIRNSRFRPTAAERRMGRFMRAPDHGINDGGENNGGADSSNNGGTGLSDENDQNNAGGEPDIASLWLTEEAPDDGQQGNQDGNSDNGGSALGQQLNQMIMEYRPNPIFTQEALTALGEGNAEQIEQGLQVFARDVLTQAVQQVVPILKAFQSQMEGVIDSRIKGNQNQLDDNAHLRETFPAAFKDPGVAPIISMTYKQALAKAKGDRSKATEITRAVVNTLVRSGGEDTGLRQPPRSDHAGASSLVADLLANV